MATETRVRVIPEARITAVDTKYYIDNYLILTAGSSAVVGTGTGNYLAQWKNANEIEDSDIIDGVSGGDLNINAILTANRNFVLPDANVTIPHGGNVAVGAGTLTQATGNDATIDNHTHAMTSTNDGTGIIAATIAAFNAAGQLTASDYFTNDGGQFGISGNELLTVDAAGLFKFTGIAGVTVEDGDYIGIASDVRIKFDATSGYIDAILGDAAGSDKFRLIDSGGGVVGTWNSSGALIAQNDITAQKTDDNVKLIANSGNGTTYKFSQFIMQHDSVARWQFYKNNDASADLIFARYNDAGTFQGSVFRADRATGYVSIGHSGSPASRLDVSAGAMRYAEMTAPSAPAANSVLVYAEDNGSGKTRLMALFSSGAAQQIAIQP